MTKLTKDIRERMARKLVNHRYTEEAKGLVSKNQELFKRAHAHCYPQDIIDAILVVAKRYPNAFDTSDHMNVNAGGFRITVGGMFSSRWVAVQQAQLTPLIMTCDYRPHNVTDEALIEEIKDFATRRKNFDELCSDAYHEALAMLNTFTTAKKLQAGWPEAIPVVGDLIPQEDRTVPVVQVEEINTKFGLPPAGEVK